MPIRALENRTFTRMAPCLMACAAAALLAGCGGAGSKAEPLLPAETFTWVRQPISFAPPPKRWYRQGENSGGLLGVYFILRDGGGQCITVVAHRQLAERDGREALAKLIARRDSLTQNEFLRELSLARPRTEDPISPREESTTRAINESLDRATTNYLAGNSSFAVLDLEGALRAASGYEPTMEELLPHIRLRPEQAQHPEVWRIGYERDTVVAGLPVFASDDTLLADGQTLLYQEIFWVVKGCAFKAVFQGKPENLETFHRVVDSITFPESDGASPR